MTIYRKHAYVCGRYSMYCQHCGADAEDISLFEMNGHPIHCTSLLDIPRVRQRRVERLEWRKPLLRCLDILAAIVALWAIWGLLT